MHAALSVEGDAVMVVGLGASVEPFPGEPFDALLKVIDFSLNIGEGRRALLGSEQG